jgi:enediyne biosynthesis protein E4
MTRWAYWLGLAFGLVLARAAAAADPPIVFDDLSALVDFQRSSVGGDALAGAAWLDYDNDGFLDLFLTNGKTQKNGLFHNDGHGGFVDVSAVAGIQNGAGNSGVVAADFDNDGFVDLFLTGDGGVIGTADSPVVLYHNNGDGTFTDITAASGIVGPATAVSAAAADIDNDGFLDLFIGAPGSLLNRRQDANRLFHNNGNLTFTDISAAAGVHTAIGAFGALFSDYNHDGFIDLLIGNGNDVNLMPTPNEMFRNNGNLTFTDVAPQAGLTPAGYWMGIESADYDHDGELDLFITNFGSNVGFPHALYRNNGNGTYTDVGVEAGVADFAFAWGCAFKDFDDDGDPDLYFAGALVGLDRDPGVLLFNNGDGTFSDFTASSPVDLTGMLVSGIASGDYDNDGFVDVVVMREPGNGYSFGAPILLHNRGNGNHSVTIRLVGTRSNREAIGARVWVTAAGRTQVQEVYAGSSFASTDSPWLTFGLGASESAEQVRVQWPLGARETFRDLPVGHMVTLVEGSGSRPDPGDCDGDGRVTMPELVQGVAIALGKMPLVACAAFDTDGDRRVDVSELLLAVRQALTG